MTKLKKLLTKEKNIKIQKKNNTNNTINYYCNS